jgi:hypothetical protein
MITAMSLENVLRIADNGYGHALLSAEESNGRVTREALPVRRLSLDTVEVLGSPGFLLGFAAGDTLRVAADHRFEVLERGLNDCIQAFAQRAVAPELIDELREQVAVLGGVVETPEHRRMIVVTVPATEAQAASEIMTAWSVRAGLDGWWFGVSS